MKKILYVILHGGVYKERYDTIKNTWGNNVDTLFYSDYEDLEKNIIKVSNNTHYNSNEEKHINVIKYLSNSINNYEWFFFCDDDTFVNTSMLESKLETFNKESVHGSVINCYPKDFSLHYCSGGAGYLIHNTVLEKITKNIQVLRTGYSDVTLGFYLKDMLIPVENHEEFKSQNNFFYNIPIEESKNYITFHYVKTMDHMNNLLNNL